MSTAFEGSRGQLRGRQGAGSSDLLFISELRWDWSQITQILIIFNENRFTRLSDGTFVCYIVAIGKNICLRM